MEHAPFGSSHLPGNGLDTVIGFDRRGTGNIGKQRNSVFCRTLEMTIGFKKLFLSHGFQSTRYKCDAFALLTLNNRLLTKL